MRESKDDFKLTAEELQTVEKILKQLRIKAANRERADLEFYNSVIDQIVDIEEEFDKRTKANIKLEEIYPELKEIDDLLKILLAEKANAEEESRVLDKEREETEEEKKLN